MSRQHTTFKKAAERIRESEFVVPVFVVFLVLWMMSIGFAVEDYWTSFWGYEALPTQTGFGWTPYVVAALPSVGQIAAGYIALALGWDAKEDRKYTVISLVVWFILFYIDAFTDMYFRLNGVVRDPSTTFAAIMQTIGIFTIGSELAFVVGFGMTMQLLPEAIGQTMSIPARMNARLNQLRDAANSFRNSGSSY
ncbi:MAG: hypothetical protein AAF490_18785 [Chloroflexota bacterium]